MSPRCLLPNTSESPKTSPKSRLAAVCRTQRSEQVFTITSAQPNSPPRERHSWSRRDLPGFAGICRLLLATGMSCTPAHSATAPGLSPREKC